MDERNGPNIWVADGVEDGAFGFGLACDPDSLEALCNELNLVPKAKLEELEKDIKALISENVFLTNKQYQCLKCM